MKRMLSLALMATVMGITSGQAAVGTISGPFAHRNLQIFLVHGQTDLEDRRYATLSEALAKGVVVITETGNVQELTIENRSPDVLVFVQAGDIVKGGRQDRTVRDDLVLPPNSGKIPLAAFCVESGRWTRRGEENSASFSMNSKVLSSRSQRLANRYGLSQSGVWSGVAEQQSKLNSNLSAFSGQTVDVRRPESASSLQLSLEDKSLGNVMKEYLDKLKPILDGKTDVIGFVYAINGEINNAEVYNNKSLFRALWPKLLDAAVTEAITEYNRRDYQPLAATDLKAFFQTAVDGSLTERAVSKTTRVKIYTTPTTLLFETMDNYAGGQWIHKNFIQRAKETVVVPLDRGSRLDQQQVPLGRARLGY